MANTSERVTGRLRRKRRIQKHRGKNIGVPRLCVFRSNRHIYAQLVDDGTAKVVVSASSLSQRKKAGDGKSCNNAENAKEVGKRLAELAKEKSVERVWFDRNGYKYHGRVKAMAEGAREAGLSF